MFFVYVCSVLLWMKFNILINVDPYISVYSTHSISAWSQRSSLMVDVCTMIYSHISDRRFDMSCIFVLQPSPHHCKPSCIDAITRVEAMPPRKRKLQSAHALMSLGANPHMWLAMLGPYVYIYNEICFLSFSCIADAIASVGACIWRPSMERWICTTDALACNDGWAW